MHHTPYVHGTELLTLATIMSDVIRMFIAGKH